MTHGCMMSEKDALELLETNVADAITQSAIQINADEYERALNRIRYRFDQRRPVKPKKHKGKYIKDWYTCGNCGVTISEIGWNYCPNCGYTIGWASTRCLTE